MKINDLMTKKVITIKKDASIIQASKLMLDNDIGFLPVVNDSNHLIGVLTDRDIVIRGLTKNNYYNLIVDDVASHNIIAIFDDKDINDALKMFSNNHIRRLIVINQNKDIKGILTLRDISKNKLSNQMINDVLYDLSIENNQKDQPLKFLKVDDFRL